ncbi:MAG: bifunctional phosphopantothenoylcysteine decarboxylase/phosphopantothenate--cysteine ligase CoaBC [Solidesulfovibrio sp.]
MQTSHLDFTGYHGRRVHLGVTGSIAAFKALSLQRRILATGAAVSVTLTEAACKFVTPLSFEALGADPVRTDMFSPESAQFAHLAPAQTADTLAIVPATADILARMAHGFAGDLLACQVLAFEGTIVVAPAMNPRLWQAAATQANWQTLLSRGVIGVLPDAGEMACGETGQGRLAREEALFAVILKSLTPQDLAGKRILVNLGPTREYFDAARFWSNPSTGRMGACLAMAAWLRGATVTVVAGPVSWWFPDDVTVIPVTSAAQMYTACLDTWPNCDVGAMSAAVADYAPTPHPGGGKFKKETSKDAPPLAFTPTRDILAAMGKVKTTSQYLIGFCAETDNLLDNARSKLARKNCDLIIANPIGGKDAGFAAASNTALALDATGRQETWDTIPKTEMAWKIWDFSIRS